MNQNADSERVVYCRSNLACLLPDQHDGAHYAPKDSEILAPLGEQIDSSGGSS